MKSFKMWHENYEETIRGEYWIIDGYVDFADGDIGDRNHEMIAIEHLLHRYVDNITSLAEEMGIEFDDPQGFAGVDGELIANVTNEILAQIPVAEFLQRTEMPQDVYVVLFGNGDARNYVIVHDGWIAIRNMNIELYGYDARKQKGLADGLWEIMESEGVELHDELEFALHDFKTNQQTYLTWKDISNPAPVVRPTIPNMNQGHSKFVVTNPDTAENQPPNAREKSRPEPWTVAAQKIKLTPPGSQLWRGTSESVRRR